MKPGLMTLDFCASMKACMEPLRWALDVMVWLREQPAGEVRDDLLAEAEDIVARRPG